MFSIPIPRLLSSMGGTQGSRASSPGYFPYFVPVARYAREMGLWVQQGAPLPQGQAIKQ